MMRILRNIRIKNKIILIISIVGVFSVISGNIANYFIQINDVKNRLIKETQLQAHLISEYCGLPLEFNYPDNATEVLLKLNSLPSVTDGILFTSQKTIFATYHRGESKSIISEKDLDTLAFSIKDNYLQIYQDVKLDGKRVGFLYIRSEVNWNTIFIKQLIVSFALTLFMIVIILVLAYYFQKSISEPIINLTKKMDRIDDFSIQSEFAQYIGKDEFGELYKGFNLMIERLQSREREKENALKGLSKSAAQYSDLYENAPDMYFSLDPNCEIFLKCNITFSRITGFNKEEIIGKSIFTIYHPDCIDNVKSAIEHFKFANEITNSEFKIVKKDGSILDVSLDMTVEKDMDDNILYYRSSWRDISGKKHAEKAEKEAVAETQRLLSIAERSRLALLSVVEDQKKAKAEINILNQTLEQRVIERTAQLEAVNKELEAFSYSVSHDLRAPLRHISGFISLFLEHNKTQLTDEELGYLNVVSNSSIEMGKLIDALLSFSRLNRSEIRKIKFDTLQIINKALMLFHENIETRKIQIVTGALLESYADPQLIYQVWINLISNAVKYTEKKEKAVVEIGSFVEGNESVFYIKDNGAGFNMKYADKLFMVFQRLHKPRDFEGIGIGLANIHRIVSRHGGRCWAEGEVDKGATIYFSLPNSL